MNIDNFDSGPGIEDIVREELRRLLPSRYSVRAGVVNDRMGQTSGDSDAIILNEEWFPSIKAGATPESRRFHFPIEAVYGVIEVKQSLNAKVLDSAMEKLISVSRLQRDAASERIVENHPVYLNENLSMQPLFTAVLATDLSPGADLEDLVHRFVAINGQVKRREVATALCVLGHGFVTWSIRPEGATPRWAFFRGDEKAEHLSPTLLKTTPESAESAFYELFTLALGYMSTMVLPVDEIAVKYGSPQQVMTPETGAYDMHPDGCDCRDTEGPDETP